MAKVGTNNRSRYTVAVGHHIITKEGLTGSDSVLVYIPIIDYRAHKQLAPSKQNNKKTGVVEKDIYIFSGRNIIAA